MATAQIHDLALERLKRLPGGTDVWQLAVIRMPSWVAGKGAAPFRPELGLCVSGATGLVGSGDLIEPGEPWAATAIQAVMALSKLSEIRHRPARIEVRDPGLADALRPILADAGIALELCDRLEGLDEVLAHMTRRFAGHESHLRLYDGPDVSVERLRAFADAAAAYYRAAPWNHLSDLDLIRVESPVPEVRMRWFTVLGGGGVVRGIGFHPSRKDHDQMQDADEEEAAMHTVGTSRWYLSFDAEFDLSIPDAELWREHGLPLAGEDAYPQLCHHTPGGRGRPASGATLTFVEGLLRALAATTEDEMDLGRWSKSVPTFDGEREVTLVLPALIEAAEGRRPRRPARPPGLPDRRLLERTMADFHRAIAERQFENPDVLNAFLASTAGKVPPHPPASTPAERAQDLVYEALEAHGRLRIKLAREALRLFPDCADAWVLLAEEMPDPERQTALYRSAMEAAQRVLGPEPFAEHVGHFWGLLETRPYMRARFGHAGCLWRAGRKEEAIAEWKELLRLNPGDNQGVRLVLIPYLLVAGRDDEAATVLAGYGEDISALLAYSRALLEFRRGGDTDASRRLLRTAVRGNPHLVKHLTGSAPLPDELPDSYRLGGEDEAAIAAESLTAPWQATPGAVAWLRDFRREAKKERERKRAKGKGGGR